MPCRFRHCRPILLGVVLMGLFLGIGLPPVLRAQVDLPALIQKAKEEPENLEVLAKLAMEYSVQREYGKALETNFRILKIDPNNFHAYNNMGIIYKKAGQYKDSLYCYENARKLKPDFYLVHYNIGLAYEAMGRMQEAREAYGRALSLNPEFSQALERLRELTDVSAGSAHLPKPPKGQIWVVDSPDGLPKQISTVIAPGSQPDAKPAGEEKKPAAPVVEQKPDAKAAGKSGEKKPAIKPVMTVTQKGRPEMVRTLKTGPGAPLFNKAMNALDEGNVAKAVEQYVACILLDRDFLSEGDNGLILKGLDLLRDRPNSVPDGLFYRGYLQIASGHKEEAVPDFRQYIEASPGGAYVAKAQELADQIEAEIQAAKEEEAAKIATTKMATEPTIEEAATYTPRLDDHELAEKTPDEILEESKRLAREGRLRDAIAVVNKGLEKDRENVRLMMALANVYTDLMLLQGDKEAGKMARDLFERILRIAPRDSNDAAVARNMAQELTGRLK